MTGTLVLPEALLKVGDYAFSGSMFSGTLRIPDSVTHIGDFSINNNGLDQVIFGKNLKYIGDSVWDKNDIKKTQYVGNCSNDYVTQLLNKHHEEGYRVALRHSFENGVCASCGAEIETLPHTEEVIPGKAATCTETGLTEGKKCSVCGEILEKQETIPALGHKWGQWTVTKPATETETGEKTRVCEHDKTHVETVEIPVIAHVHKLSKTEAVAATCTKDGNIAYWTCSGCQKLFRDEAGTEEITKEETVLTKLGHKWDNGVVTTEPSCTEKGVKTFTCQNDKTHTRTEEIAALGHKEEIIPGKAATCTETGLTEGKKCSVCGEILEKQTVLAKIPHTPGEPVVENLVDSTTETEGAYDEVVYCTVCGEALSRETKVIEKKPVETFEILVKDSEHGKVTASAAAAPAGTEITLTVEADEGYVLQSLTVTDSNGEPVALKDGSTFKMPAAAVTVAASFRAVDPIPGNPFEDVAESRWSYGDIMYVYENGLMIGTTETTFSPEAETTRGMVVTLLYRLEGEPEVTGKQVFADVNVNAYCGPAVEWAAANEIVLGYQTGEFRPDESISREQMATILYRYAKFKGYDLSAGDSVDLGRYDDYDKVHDFAIPGLRWACGVGIIKGFTDRMLAPRGYAKREQVAVILHRFCETIAK